MQTHVDIYGEQTCRHTYAQAYTHCHIPSHPQTSLQWKCTFSTLKMIVHCTKWETLELWVILSIRNQPHWADIISSKGEEKSWNIWDNEGLEVRGWPQRLWSTRVIGDEVMKVDWTCWTTSSSVSWMEEGDCDCVGMCATSTNQMRAAGWWKIHP